jgi:mannose-6-phosphate isomerase-like protein (cupin superfamily)
MERTFKSWGTKTNVFLNDLCEVSVLDLSPFQRCSWHSHKTKFNDFYVIRGELFIKTDWGTARVGEGQTFTTRPGEWHEFQTHKTPCLVLETMYVLYNPEDIERKTIGGPLDE